MKRLMLFGVCFFMSGLVQAQLFGSSPRPVAYKTNVILDNHFRQANYNKITISQVDCQWFISNGKFFKDHKDNNGEAVSQLNDLNAEVQNQMEIFGDKYVASRTGTRELKLQAIVTDFVPALAGDLIGGAHSGYVKYTIRFWDGVTEVARIECEAPISMPVRRNFQANDTTGLDASLKGIPQLIIRNLRVFIYQH